MGKISERSVATNILRGPVVIYRRLLSTSIAPRCRFYPTCSKYYLQALDKYGPWKGMLIGAKRILRCHPFSEGGCDPLP